MDEQKGLSYTGPDKDYKPQPGSGTVQYPKNTVSGYGYGNIDRLKSNISKILETSNKIIEQSDDELKQFSLDVTNSEKLFSAAKATWLNFENEKNNAVPYSSYQDLQNDSDRSSKYIRDEFKKALREPNGSSAIDIRSMADAINIEAQRISSLINTHITSNQDSAEHRLVELFLDWTNDCSRHLTRLDSFFKLGLGERNKKIPKEELELLTKNEAAQYQALFTVKNNALNQEIDMKFDELKRKYLNTSDLFYSKFLGPTLAMRTKVSTDDLGSSYEGSFSSSVKDIKDAANRSMTISLYDTLERTNDFNQLFLELEDLISLRENYNGYIRQLQSIGVFYSRTTKDEGLSNLDLQKSAKNDSLTNSHNSLSGRLEDLAHPQYLLKRGDVITGDIKIIPGHKVDGVSPGAHAHTGSDGSTRILGSSIVKGTVTSKSVSKTEIVQKPHNVRVIDYTGDNRLQSAVLFFHTEKKYPIYEIDVKLISTTEFVDPGQGGVITPPVTPPSEPVLPGYIPPFEANAPLYIEWITEIDYELFFN